MNQAVVVLNADHQIINIVHWQRAVNLVLNGRAQVVEESDRIISQLSAMLQAGAPALTLRRVRYLGAGLNEGYDLLGAAGLVSADFLALGEAGFAPGVLVAAEPFAGVP